VRKKILVVDDDPEVIELLRFNLKKAGFAIGTAANGVEALMKVRSLAPDLILLDLMLPELDGLAVCETLRRNPLTASTPIVMLTAVPGALARLAGFESGATEFVAKPFSPRELIQVIQNVLRGAISGPKQARA
jgi:two-component system alkaline phosphatase synthesis response regulator PhoP